MNIKTGTPAESAFLLKFNSRFERYKLWCHRLGSFGFGFSAEI